VALTANGRSVVSASDDKTLKIWELDRGTMIATFSCDASVRCCTLANDRTIVAGDAAGAVYVLALEM